MCAPLTHTAHEFYSSWITSTNIYRFIAFQVGKRVHAKCIMREREKKPYTIHAFQFKVYLCIGYQHMCMCDCALCISHRHKAHTIKSLGFPSLFIAVGAAFPSIYDCFVIQLNSISLNSTNITDHYIGINGEYMRECVRKWFSTQCVHLHFVCLFVFICFESSNVSNSKRTKISTAHDSGWIHIS